MSRSWSRRRPRRSSGRCLPGRARPGASARSRSACSSSPRRRRSSWAWRRATSRSSASSPSWSTSRPPRPSPPRSPRASSTSGATGLTAALYNIVLGGEKLWIVADKGREWPGYPLAAHRGAEGAVGRRPPRRSRISRASASASPSSARRSTTTSATILEKDGLTLADVRDRAAPGHAGHDGGAQGQAGRRRSWSRQPFPGAAGGRRASARSSPGPAISIPWQIATIFYSKPVRRRSRPRRGLHEGLRQGLAPLLRRGAGQKDGRRRRRRYDEVVAITAKYTGASAGAHPQAGFPTRTATAA